MLARISGAILMVAVAFAVMPVAVAVGLPIAAFAGHFAGTSAAKDEISETFDNTLRNIDVIITPDGDGFALSWATVFA